MGGASFRRLGRGAVMAIGFEVLGLGPEGLVGLVDQMHGVLVVPVGHQGGHAVEVFKPRIGPIGFDRGQQPEQPPGFLFVLPSSGFVDRDGGDLAEYVAQVFPRVFAFSPRALRRRDCLLVALG